MVMLGWLEVESRMLNVKDRNRLRWCLRQSAFELFTCMGPAADIRVNLTDHLQREARSVVPSGDVKRGSS